MTSMPASRSARAMIFAPRSCPSSPGLATTTRILRAMAARLVVPAGSSAHRPAPPECVERRLNDEGIAGEAVLGGHAAQDRGHRRDARGAVAAGVRGDGDAPIG